MQTFINAIIGTIGTLAFCGLLAWIESVPLPDSAMDHFVAGGTFVIDLIQEVLR